MFSPYDKVFAKVRGHQPWPAYINKIEKCKYEVIFFGTNEVGFCKENDLFNYNTYMNEVLPKKKTSASLLQAMKEADNYSPLNAVEESSEETFSFSPQHDEVQHNENSFLYEITSQLEYEKKKAETSLRLAEEESEEMCRKFEEEILSLKDENVRLKKELRKKGNELKKAKLSNSSENEKNEICYLSPKVLVSTGTQTENNDINKFDIELLKDLSDKLKMYEQALSDKEFIIMQLKDTIDELKETAVFPKPGDPEFQLNALTDKYIHLEKELMEAKEIPSDYHMQILKDELNKYKTENTNLSGIMEELLNDNKKLEEEINLTKSQNQRCSSCFPPLNSTMF